MSAVVAPTITAYEPHEFREQLSRLEPFATRIHIDLMDGDFAPAKSVNPIQVYWPKGMTADIHLMFRRPLEHLETLVSLAPHLAIIHAEAEGDLRGMIEHLHKCGIQAGVALLQSTQPSAAADLIMAADHALIFSGHLGHHGGTADLALLAKVTQIRQLNPQAEIAWDGGINAQNAPTLLEAGITVLDVGGFVQKADDPSAAYHQLAEIIRDNQ